MIVPFYLIVLLPVLFLQPPGIKFSLWLAMVPVVNVTMMVRNAIGGTLGWMQAGVTVLVSLLLIAAGIRLATFILQFEEIRAGSGSGGIRRFFKQHVFRKTRPVPPDPFHSP